MTASLHDSVLALLSSGDSQTQQESSLTLFDNRLGRFLTGSLPDSQPNADEWAVVDLALDLHDEMLLPPVAWPS